MASDKRIRIILDSKDAEKNAKDLDKATKGAGKSADGAQFSFNKLAAAIATVFAVDKLKQYADAFTSIQNQIRRTTDNQQQLNQTTRDLLRLANETRADLGATTELYTSLAISTKNLGLSQEEVFGITKTINNLFLESGKSAEEASGAIRQLGQAFDKGKLNGDEFVSVAEGAPGILRAIQVESGKTRDQLAQMAEKGLLSTELITLSLRNYGDEAQKAADKTKVTLGQAFTIAGNNATFFVGEVNDATGASSSFAQTIIDLSKRLSSQENIDNFILFFKQLSGAISQTERDLNGFNEQLNKLGQDGADSVNFIGRAFRDFGPNVRATVQVVVVEVASMIDKLSAKFKQFDDYLANFMDGDNAEKSLQNYENRIKAINTAKDESIDQIFKERDAIVETARAEIAARNAVNNAGANSNFGNKTNAAPAETADQEKARKKQEQLRVNLFKEVEAEIEAEGKRQDIADREIASAQNVTAQLKIELDKRKQISQIYKEQALSLDQGIFEQQRAMQKAKELEDLANVQAAAAEESQRRSEQMRQALENENLEASERLRIKQEYELQERLQTQINEEQKTAIIEQGKRARAELDKAEYQSRLDNAAQLGSALMSLGQGQSKKIFKIGQTLALAQAAVALPTAVMESFKNGGGYPWGLVPAATMLATGLKNIQQIRSAGGSLGGGGGGGSIGASIGGGGGSAAIPTSTSTEDMAVQQKRIYDLRGVKADDKISISAMAQLLEDDGAVVLIENARADAARRNVIGVTAR